MKKNILLVDDEQIFHFINKKVIEKAGISCQFHSAVNGLEAVHFINSYLAGKVAAPDLILLDLNMPVMDGFEFLSTFQKMKIPNKENIVIVILTSSISTSDMDKALAMGIHNFIIKPLKETDVLNIVFAASDSHSV